ncbi:MAG: hotdog fold thioesterase [Bacteroidota bacterium]
MAKKRIFPENLSLDAVNSMGKGCMIAHLGIHFIEAGDNYLKATMPVDHRTKQPLGLLHGGASVALAETMGSVGAALCLDLNKQYAVGLEINANHIKPAKEGVVTGYASPIHIGTRTHVWNIEIKNSESQLIAMSRITMAILDRR